jgi:hypothetical protein
VHDLCGDVESLVNANQTGAVFILAGASCAGLTRAVLPERR